MIQSSGCGFWNIDMLTWLEDKISWKGRKLKVEGNGGDGRVYIDVLEGICPASKDKERVAVIGL
jgi:hypothetical protein